MRVSDLVGEGHERAMRVLLPVREIRGQWHAWADTIPGAVIDDVATWEQVSDGASALVQPSYGSLSEQTFGALVAALARDGERGYDFIHWADYAKDDILPYEDVVVPAWVLPLIRRLSVDPKKSIRQGVPLGIVVIRELLS